jgi:hypothetical protein
VTGVGNVGTPKCDPFPNPPSVLDAVPFPEPEKVREYIRQGHWGFLFDGEGRFQEQP